MSILTNIAVFLLDAIFSASCIFMPAARAKTPAVESIKDIFHPITLSETVVLVNADGWSRDEYNVLCFLQGITARDGKADIFIMRDDYPNYVEAYKKANPQQTFEEFAGTVWDLTARFADQITDKGYVIYAPAGDDQNPGINMAATIAGAEGWLGIPASCIAQTEAAGLTLKRDLREMQGSYAQQQRAIFLEYKEKLNNALMIHQPPDNSALRDFGIAQRAFCFFANNSANAIEYARELQLFWSVFSWAKPNASVFGVWNSAGELPFVRKLSKASLNVVPADHLYNGSTLMGFEAEGTLKQPYVNRDIKAEPGKHYAALMLSDGDNVQWLAGGAFFHGFIADRLQSNDTFPLSLTYAPYMAELFPFVTQHHYSMLGNDTQLICGVSGLGYTNLTAAPAKARKSYAQLTAEGMQQADLRVMQLLDDVSIMPGLIGGRTPLLGLKAKGIVNDFAAQEAIQGGVWYMDPNKYESGGGKLYQSKNDKLWICNRISFWGPDNARENVTPEWIQSMADIINAYPYDPTSAEGYSVINIHPWSIDYSALQQLVALLDDDVVLLSAEEFVAMATENLL